MPAMQPADFGGEFFRIAVPPLRPEAALAAIGAAMRAAARELHHGGPLSAPVAVAGKIGQLPADAVAIEIRDERCRRRGDRISRVAKGETGDLSQWHSTFQRVREVPHGFLAFAADDDVDGRALGQDFAPVIGRERAAIDDRAAWHCSAKHGRDGGNGGMRRRRTGVPEQHGIRSERCCPFGNASQRQRSNVGIQKRDDVTSVTQRAADREQPKRRQVLVRYATTDRRMRRIDNEDAHW
jgi:hypothetical protein